MKQTTGVFAVLTAALFLGSMTGVGCGGDDDNGSGGAAGSGGSAGSTGGTGGKGGTGGSTGGTGGTGGGTGGSSGTAGKGGTAGSDAGPDAPATVMCGTSTCTPVTTMFGNLPACCPMDSPNACGAAFPLAGNACLTKTPGVADSTCPSVNLGGFPLTGCCRPNGLCGVDLSGIMLGCNDPGVLPGGTAGGPCGGDAAPPPVDAGSDTGTADTGTADTGTTDTGTTDTGTTDTGTTDTGTTDTGTTDTGTTDTGGGTG